MAMILCIDDRTYYLSSTADLLRHAGYNIVLASDSHAAVELLFGNPIDAVLLDCHQLGDQGGDLVAALRIVRPDVPIVMMSAHCRLPCDSLRQANACVQKGDTARALLRTLEAVICASRFGLCRSVAA
jgi:DNA-binding NtrC family response regulator